MFSLKLRQRLAAGLSQKCEEGLQLSLIRELIQADAESGGIRRRCAIGQDPQIETCHCCSAVHSRCRRTVHGDGVEAIGDLQRIAKGPQAMLQLAAQANNALGDGLQTVGPVMHRIKRGHHGEQHLGRADVAGGLVATDVLLTGLQRQTQGRAAFCILGLPHQTAGDLALVGLNRGEEGGMGATETHRHPKALGAAHGNVSPQGSHGRHQGLRQGIDGHGGQGTGGMGRVDHG